MQDKYKGIYVKHGLQFYKVHGLVMEINKQDNIAFLHRKNAIIDIYIGWRGDKKRWDQFYLKKVREDFTEVAISALGTKDEYILRQDVFGEEAGCVLLVCLRKFEGIDPERLNQVRTKLLRAL